MADITDPLKYGRVTGLFEAVIEDSTDAGDAPDTVPLSGTVTFTPSYSNIRVTHADVTKRRLVYLEPVPAKVTDGVLTDREGKPGVSLLATTGRDGGMVPYDLAWNASFNLTRTDGVEIQSQPKSVWASVYPDVTTAISDFLPDKIDNKQVVITNVDRSTLLKVSEYVDSIEDLIGEIKDIRDNGAIVGPIGPAGPTGIQGERGPTGERGAPGTTETFNYVTNPIPTSNSGYKGINGTVTYNSNTKAIDYKVTGTGTPKAILYSNLTPVNKAMPVYINYRVGAGVTQTLKTTAIFLNAAGKTVDSVSTIHTAGTDDEVTSLITPPTDRILTHSAQTYTDASYVVFTMGFADNTVPVDTTLSVFKVMLSNAPDQYFSGADTISGSKVRWAGTDNASYSVKTPDLAALSNVVTSVNTLTGDITLTRADFGLDKVDNTFDFAKPISTLQQAALDSKINISAVSEGLLDQAYGSSSQSAFLADFSRFSADEITQTTETYVDISYATAPAGGYSFIRAVIPGTSAGATSSSVPTIQRSSNGFTWTNWVTLETGTVPSNVKYTDIDVDYDVKRDRVYVIVKKVMSDSSNNVNLLLYSIGRTGVFTSTVLSSTASATAPHNNPSIVTNPDGTGSLLLYTANSSGVFSRYPVTFSGSTPSLGSSVGLTGVTNNSSLRVSRLYGTFVGAVSTSGPDIITSNDGITWVKRSGSTANLVPGTTAKVSAYSGVSKGRIGIYVSYIDSGTVTPYIRRSVFVSAGAIIRGSITGVKTTSQETANTAVSFTAPFTAVPYVTVSSNDSKMILSITSVTNTGFTVERYNVGPSASSNATIQWQAQS